MSLRPRCRPLLFTALLSLSCATSGGGAAPPPGTPASSATAEPGAPAAPSTVTSGALAPGAILERTDLAAYHGLIRYLAFRAEHADERFGKNSDAARRDHEALASWTRRILDNPQTLSDLRGVVEWAYVSPVDGSGQPFRLMIPTDYQPGRPTPLVLHMHGYSGNHIEHSGFQAHPGSFEVSVLGRSRGGRYRALSEADVLHVLDYVEANWSIDPRRVHLKGGSMGGGGTFWIGSRYPHRFASGRPVCGFASDLPVGNLLTLPLYATHSADDYTVSVLHARGPIARLLELGGKATLDVTTGLGHEAWKYEKGELAAEAWSTEQVRPSSNEVQRLDYTALDGRATRSWWAQIVEWGARPEPASVSLDVPRKNELTIRTNNVARLALRVADSPIDPTQPLSINIDGARVTQKPPVAATLTLTQPKKGAWAVESSAPELPFRLHTPGGANQLYDGDPLLIVYGTRGAADVTAALKNAAAIASHSANAAWPSPNGETTDDGVSHNQNLYGDLRTIADVDVTAEQLASHDLVLIGTAEQNALVARMADRLPARYDGDTLRLGDGTREPSQNTVLGLVHYNPLAPSRLVFWVASPDAAAYRADALVPQLLGGGPTGVDLLVTRATERQVVLTRSFDSRWGWVSREGSPALPPSGANPEPLARMLAESARRATGADFAVAYDSSARAPVPTFAPGSIRLLDLAALIYYEPISVMTLSGAQLADARLALAATPEAHVQPEPDAARIDPRKSYRVAITGRQIWPLVGTTHLAPEAYVTTKFETASALLRSGFVGL